MTSLENLFRVSPALFGSSADLDKGPSSSTSSSTKRKPERGRDPSSSSLYRLNLTRISLDLVPRRWLIHIVADEIYKSIKRTGTADVRNSASVAVESPKGVDNEDEDAVAGPEMPPDEEEADDEEGRFFGGGITKDTAEVLDFVNDQDETGLVSSLCVRWGRATC